MKRLSLVVAGVLMLAACGDSIGPSSAEGPQNTILIPGNVATCDVIDFVGCFAVLDNEFKILYERNNALSRRGEAEYAPASRSNKELANVFLSTSLSQAKALSYLDKFISQVSAAFSAGQFSACAANQILARAQWLRAKVAAGDVDVSNPTPWDCEISPVTLTGVGTVSAGVTVTVNDPWDYNNDIYGVYDNQTYFTVERAVGAGAFAAFLTTPIAPQPGPVIFTIPDAASNVLGETYTYRVIQCTYSWGFCSTPATVAVTVTATSDGGGDDQCAHDNRNGNWVDNKTKPKCDKEDKIFKNK